MEQRNKSTNPDYSLSSRPFLDPSEQQYQFIMRHVYNFFRTSEVINYFGTHHAIVSRSTRPLHKQCDSSSKSKILGKLDLFYSQSPRKDKERDRGKIKKKLSDHKHIKSSTKVKAVFFN